MLTHPTAPVLPVALALGERDELDGRDVLMGYLIGVEVETKVSEAIDPRHYDTGFHSTATAGSIGAGSGRRRLLGLDAAAHRGRARASPPARPAACARTSAR